MKFYGGFCVDLANLQRFNSQRDEILLKHIVGLLLLFLVSIPNGMEFYKSQENPHNTELSFNSQRDGILHRA